MITLEFFDRRWGKWKKIAESKPGASVRVPNYTPSGLEIILLTDEGLRRLFFGKSIDLLTLKSYVPNESDVSEFQIIDFENPVIVEVPIGHPLITHIRFRKRGRLQKVRFTRS